jgi:hypothetical protein
MGGWDQLRSRLVGDCLRNDATQEVLWDTGKPALFLFDTCRDLIRTLPALQHDKSRAEDVDTEGEDHAADELRYACMSRPYIAPARPVKPLRRDGYGRKETAEPNGWKVA